MRVRILAALILFVMVFVSSNPFTPAIAGVLTDTDVLVEFNEVRSYPYEFKGYGKGKYTVEVLRGGPIDIWVFTEREFKLFSDLLDGKPEGFNSLKSIYFCTFNTRNYQGDMSGLAQAGPTVLYLVLENVDLQRTCKGAPAAKPTGPVLVHLRVETTKGTLTEEESSNPLNAVSAFFAGMEESGFLPILGVILLFATVGGVISYVRQKRKQSYGPAPVNQGAAIGGFCPRCGYQNTSDSNFCKNCGSRLV